MTATSVSDIVIRATDPLATAAFLTTFGAAIELLPPIPPAQSAERYGEAVQLAQFRAATPGTFGGVRVVETRRAVRHLEPFTAGGYGIDYYTSDVELAARLATRRATLPAPPLAWQEDGQELIEARLVDPSDTFAVFLPQMERISRLHPSALDDDPARMYSELCMTSWIVPDGMIADERAFWTEVAGLDVVLETEMDAADMGTLMGHRAAPLRSIQFAKPGSPCLVDLLSYPTIDVDGHLAGGAVAAIALDVPAAGLPAFGCRRSKTAGSMIADRGRGPEQLTLAATPSGIPLELWSAA